MHHLPIHVIPRHIGDVETPGGGWGAWCDPDKKLYHFTPDWQTGLVWVGSVSGSAVAVLGRLTHLVTVYPPEFIKYILALPRFDATV